MKFAKFSILIFMMFLAKPAESQSPNVNQFLNSQLISTFSATYGESGSDNTLVRFDKFPNLKYRRGTSQNAVFEQLRKINFMHAFLSISPVSDVPEFLRQGRHSGEIALNSVMQLPVSISSKLITLKLQAPHPKEYDTGNIGQISPGSWVRLTKQFSFVFDLPMYFYSINYNRTGSAGFRNQIKFTEKSLSRGEVIPLIYSVKIGMGIDF